MGRAWTFGENMNTDEIIPGRYNITIDPVELARNVFCEVKPEYAQSVKPGDVIVGGQTPGGKSKRALEMVRPFEEAGGTWWLENVWGAIDKVRKRIKQGPPGAG